MQRTKFSRACMLKAVRLVREREVAVSPVACDLDAQENVLRESVKELPDDAGTVVDRATLTAKRYILKGSSALTMGSI